MCAGVGAEAEAGAGGAGEKWQCGGSVCNGVVGLWKIPCIMVDGCPLCVRLAGIETDPLLVARLKHCVVVLGENQGAAGWCTLVLRRHVEHLGELSIVEQGQVFEEVAAVGGAIRAVYGGVRLNYECLGNVCPHVHWHVVPRHGNDPTPRATVWGWPARELAGEATRAERETLAARLRGAMGENGAG